MKNIEIIATGMYLPSTKIDNTYLSKKLNTSEDFIYKRTGIQTRYYSKDESIDKLAIKSVENLKEKNSKINIKNVDMIIVATTSTNMLMPGISYKIQKHFDIKNCMCLDILAGCAGFINALDIYNNKKSNNAISSWSRFTIKMYRQKRCININIAIRWCRFNNYTRIKKKYNL